VRVHVTQADIDVANEARQGESHFMFSTGCPIARALRREFSNNREVWVDGDFWGLTHQDGEALSLPNEAVQFAADWDSNQPVNAFDFEV
jgi:hypothetical protein